MKDYIPIRDVWDFEKFMATKPKLWVNTAYNLKCSAESLYILDLEKSKSLFEEESESIKQLNLGHFWSAGVIRMLVGFSLENLIKAILLKSKEKLTEAFSKEGNLSWGRDGHNLLKLFKNAEINVSKTESKYLELWQLCSLWAGRYPIPVNENNLPKQRTPLPSREALNRRAKKRIENALKEDDPFLGAEISDLLSSGVTGIEFQTFTAIYNRCEECALEE